MTTTLAHSDLDDSGPFDAGPYPWLTRARSFRFVGATTRRAVLTTALVTWLPLALLAALEGHAFSSEAHKSILLDLEAFVRYLVAAPLFVGAASVYLPQLASTVRTFVEAGLIGHADRPRYDRLVASTRRLLTSRLTDGGIIGLAYLVTFTLSPVISTRAPSWASAGDRLFLAGWWRMLVSQPLFIALWAVWLWRLLLWARFLWTVARMNLHLVAGHPDQLGGLRFVLISLRGFSILGFALGAVAAGSVAEAIMVDGRVPAEFKFLVGAQVVAVVAAFGGPLLLLSLPLVRMQERGTVEYGRLASRLGRQFQTRWVETGHRQVDSETLGVPDFSATVDLFGVVANTREVNPLVLDVRHVAMLAGATLLPYVPVVFAVVPVDQILKFAMNALL